MKKLKRLVIFFIFCSLLLSACWDSVEVEKRGFVNGIAIDLAKSQNADTVKQVEQSPEQEQIQGQQLQPQAQNEGQETQEELEKDEEKKFKLTQQLIVPSGLSSSQSGGGLKGPAYRNLSQTGDTIIEMNRDMIKQADRKTNVTHLNIVLFSQELVEEENRFAQLMDIFLREKEMLRGVKVAITMDQASDFLDILPVNEKVPSQYISKLLDNKATLEITKPISVGDIQGLLLSNKSFVLPLLSILNSTTVNYEGLSIYHGTKNKPVGTLIGDDVKGLNLIKSEKQTGTINVNMDDHKVTFELLEINTNISLQNKDKNNLKFNITINTTAGIAEQYGSIDVIKPEEYKKLNTALKKEIKKITEQTVNTLQNDLHADVLGLDTHLYQYHYDLWQSIKDDWSDGEDYFSKSDVNIEVNATIEKTGNIIESN